MNTNENDLKYKPKYVSTAAQHKRAQDEWYKDIRIAWMWWTYRDVWHQFIKLYKNNMIWIEHRDIKWFIDIWIENSSLIRWELSSHWLASVPLHRNTVSPILKKLKELNIIYKKWINMYVVNPAYASIWEAVPSELIDLFKED